MMLLIQLLFFMNLALANQQPMDMNVVFPTALNEYVEGQNATFNKWIEDEKANYNLTGDIDQILSLKQSTLEGINNRQSQGSMFPHQNLEQLTSNELLTNTNSPLLFDFQRPDYVAPSVRANRFWNQMRDSALPYISGAH